MKIGQLLPWVLLFLVLAVSVETCVQSSKRERVLLENIKIARDSVVHFKNKAGELVNQVRSISLTADELKRDGEALGVSTDSLKRVVGNLRNLVSYYKGKLLVKGETVVRGRDTVVVQAKDTVKLHEKAFNFTNGYLTLSQLYDPKSDTLRTKYRYQTDFDLTVYMARENKFNIFERRKMMADFKLHDPNAELLKAKSIVIKQPRKPFFERWWFGFVLGGATGVWLLH